MFNWIRTLSAIALMTALVLSAAACGSSPDTAPAPQATEAAAAPAAPAPQSQYAALAAPVAPAQAPAAQSSAPRAPQSQEVSPSATVPPAIPTELPSPSSTESPRATPSEDCGQLCTEEFWRGEVSVASVRAELDGGADPRGESNSGLTPLHWATRLWI